MSKVRVGDEYVVTLKFRVGETWGGNCVCTDLGENEVDNVLDVDYAQSLVNASPLAVRTKKGKK